MGSGIEPTPKSLPQFGSYLYHFLAIAFGGMLVNPSESQSPPLQNGFVGRLKQIDIELLEQCLVLSYHSESIIIISHG